MTTSSHDPHNNEHHVEFCRYKSELKRSWLGWIINFPTMLYNSYLLIRHAELYKAIRKNTWPTKWMGIFRSLFINMQVTANQSIMREMLKHPRKDPESGLFDDDANFKTMLVLLQDMYPSENIQVDDFLLTCNQQYINQYRQPILQFLGPQNLKKRHNEIKEIVSENIEFHMSQPNQLINIENMALIYSTSMISRLLLDHPGPFSIYQQIAFAIGSLNKIIMKKIWNRPLSSKEREEYTVSLNVIREAIELSLREGRTDNPESFVNRLLKERKYSDNQMRSMLFLMYFAGSETTASLLTYVIWQLGQKPEWQAQIHTEIKQQMNNDIFDYSTHSELLNNIFSESIRLHNPAYVIGRRPAADLHCTVKNKEGKILYQKSIPKNQTFLAAPSIAARNSCLFENPDEFNPDRFTTVENKNLSWLPFGYGKHACPGQWLAKTEIMLFTASLVKRCEFSSMPDNEMSVKGYMTLKPASLARLSIIKRRE